MKYFLLLIFVCLFSITVIAQTKNSGKISGHVNAENATISLLTARDSVLVKVAVSDKDGLFEFENIAAGSYFIRISHAGYQKGFSNTFAITETAFSVKLPDIILLPQAGTLGEVTVQSKKPFIERKADRMIVNVENSIISTGATALEVLEKSPGVMVNQESGINLKGKSGVTVMIDGKPSPLSGLDLINYLKSIPSANIEKVELITNPSAKYDAAGNAGIIDIRFKKDKRDGYNGTAGFSMGQGVYSKPSVNAAVNFRSKKWNLFTTNAFTAPENFTNFHITRKFFTGGNGPLESVFDQVTFTKQPQQSANLRLGADYYASKKTVIGVLLNGTFYNGTRDGLSDAAITDAAGVLQFKNQTANVLKDKRYNLLGNFNFKHTIDSAGKEINADLDFGKFHTRPL